MRRKGASEAAIYAATNKIVEGTPYAGISYDAANSPRFEISDHDAKLVPSGLDASGRGAMGGFLRHPELYKALPSAERLSVNKGGTQGNAAFDGRTVYLGDRNFAGQMLAGRPRARQTVRGPLLHELQHHGQDAGDRPRGASPNDFRGQYPGDSFEAKTRRHIQYGRVAGEVEAEVSRLSANMTPAERRAEHPNDRAKRFGLADGHPRLICGFFRQRARVEKADWERAVSYLVITYEGGLDYEYAASLPRQELERLANDLKSYRDEVARAQKKAEREAARGRR